MFPAGDSSQLQIQTWAPSKGEEDDSPSKWCPERSERSSIYIRQNRFQYKICDKGQRWILYNKGDNSPRNNTLIDMHPTWEHQNI